eukprot:scaffold10518_cov68-Phaeocystis_antarctica.AAC.2
MACQMEGWLVAVVARWQASLGPASGASHDVWSPQWAVSGPISTTAGPLVRECECVHARAVVTWRDHEQEWSPGRRVHGRRGMPWQRWVCSACDMG